MLPPFLAISLLNQGCKYEPNENKPGLDIAQTILKIQTEVVMIKTLEKKCTGAQISVYQSRGRIFKKSYERGKEHATFSYHLHTLT